MESGHPYVSGQNRMFDDSKPRPRGVGIGIGTTSTSDRSWSWLRTWTREDDQGLECDVIKWE